MFFCFFFYFLSYLFLLVYTQSFFQFHSVLVHSAGKVFVSLVHGTTPGPDVTGMHVTLGNKPVSQWQQ